MSMSQTTTKTRASHFRDALIAGFIGLAIAALLMTIGITIAAAVAHSSCNHLNHNF
jgi:hypothetical protein